MIGLIGAMTVEVELIKGSMTEKREETISGITFVQGKLEGVDCVAAVSGIGKVNAAMCAQTMISPLPSPADYQYRCGRRHGERN